MYPHPYEKNSNVFRLFVLGLLIGETLASPVKFTTLASAHPGPCPERHYSQINGCDKVHIRNVFPKFPTNHLLSNLDLLVCLAVVDGEAQTDKVGENGCRALLRPDWRRVGGRGECSWEGETVYPVLLVLCCGSIF